MEDKYKVCGWAFAIYGALIIFLSVIIYSMIPINSTLNFLILNYALFSVVSVVGLLTFLCGIQFFKGNPNVHKFALPLSILALINVPIGSAVGGLYLWLRYKDA